MIGIVITGHGHFPSGLLSAIELVAGKPENTAEVDFRGGQSSDELKTAMKQAIASLEGDDILILADLVGGTPFNTAALLKEEIADKNIRVIAGANMAATVEAVFSRGFASFEDLVPMVKEAGIRGITDLSDLDGPSEEPDFGDGL